MTVFTLAAAPVAALVWAVALYSLIGWRHRGTDAPTEDGPAHAQPRPGHRVWMGVSVGALPVPADLGLRRDRRRSTHPPRRRPAGRERHRSAVGLDLQLPAARQHRVRPALPAGRPAGRLQRDEQRRHPLVLGRADGHQGRRQPGRRRPTTRDARPARHLRRAVRRTLRPAARRHGDQRPRGEPARTSCRGSGRTGRAADDRSTHVRVKEGGSHERSSHPARRHRPADRRPADAAAQRRHGRRGRPDRRLPLLAGGPPLPADRRPRLLQPGHADHHGGLGARFHGRHRRLPRPADLAAGPRPEPRGRDVPRRQGPGRRPLLPVHDRPQGRRHPVPRGHDGPARRRRHAGDDDPDRPDHPELPLPLARRPTTPSSACTG